MWAKPGKQVCSGIRGRFLTDELHLGGAVHIIQESIIIKVSAVFISVTETGPVVRLPGFPPPGLHSVRRLVHPLPAPSPPVRQTDPVKARHAPAGHKVPLLVVVQNEQVSLLCFTPVSGLVPGPRITAEEVTVGLKHSPTHRTTTTCS